MRILIFSDLHANREALQSLQRVETKPDALLFLGDAVGYGPDPAFCASWVAQNVTAAVQGDHDQAAASGADCASPDEWLELAHATREVHRRLLPQRALDYFAALPPTRTVELGGARFVLTHNLGESDSLSAKGRALQEFGEAASAEIILCGHTHVPMLRRLGANGWLVNPGSLGQPRHGLPSATYAVWEDGSLRIQHIDYDPRPTVQKLSLLPLDPEHLTRLQITLARGM